jgi:hypothetical protein
MTPEQKRKVPRHLRGAGKRRFFCSACDTYHGFPVNLCRNHPSYARTKANSIEASRDRAIALLPKLLESVKRRWEDPQEHRRQSERTAAMNRRRAKAGLLSGENNPNYGRKHSPQARLRMSAKVLAHHRARYQAQVEEMVPPALRGPLEGFPPRVGEVHGGDLWRPTSVPGPWSDEFDPFR